jgi:AraC-like DNA-binding protein
MPKKLKTVLKQNSFRTYPGLNKPINFNFIPIEVGHVQCPPGYVWDRKIRDNLTIHYVYSGQGVFEKDGKSYTLKRGDAFVFDFKDEIKYTADKKDPWHYYWIHFYSPRFAQKLKTLESPVFKTSNESAFTDSVSKGERGLLTSEFLISKLYLLYDDIFNPSPIVNEDIAIEAARLINDNYRSGITVERLAEHFGVSRSYFSTFFKAKHGISVKQYIIRVRFGKAKELLERGYSIKEAAYLCGYTDQLAFSKMYKKVYGITPKSVYESSK